MTVYFYVQTSIQEDKEPECKLVASPYYRTREEAEEQLKKMKEEGSPFSLWVSQKVLDEPVLEDNYPIYPGYAYVINGRVISSPLRGTVKNLKQVFAKTHGETAKEVRRCDLVGRGFA